MDANKKIERQYKKWELIQDSAKNEYDQKKADAAFNKLFNMFENKELFNQYWETKTTSSFSIK